MISVAMSPSISGYTAFQAGMAHYFSNPAVVISMTETSDLL